MHVARFHNFIRYQDSLDVFILLQISPEQTQKQQKHADRTMKESHQKSSQEPKKREGSETGAQHRALDCGGDLRGEPKK
jgi:hypothetical protein